MWLFKKKNNFGLRYPNLGSETNREIRGSDIPTQIQDIIDATRKEGFNPIASVKLYCTECNAAISLKEGGAFSPDIYEFIHSEDRRNGVIQPINEPLVCEQCNGNTFQLKIRPVTFKDWLRETLPLVRMTDQDPAFGFRDKDTGELFLDPLLKRASSFDGVWKAIASYVDPFGDINPHFEYDMTFDGQNRYRRIDRRVPGLRHVNYRARLESSYKKVKVLVTILIYKDGSHWYSIEWD